MVNALIDVGSKVGPIVGTLLGGLLVARCGWRPLFWVLGFGALIWVPFWLAAMPPQVRVVRTVASGGPRLGEILRRRNAWATFAGLFCANYLWYFLLTWLPTYLVQERHFSLEEMAIVGALPYAVTATATTFAGMLSYRAIAAGAAPTVVRKVCTVGGLALATVVAAVPAVPNVTVAMAVLLLACVGYGTYTSSHWAITQTLAGRAACGRWTGAQNFFGNLSGVVGPLVTGFVVGATGRFFWAFVVIAAVCLSGSMIYLFGLKRVEPEVWSTDAVPANPDLPLPDGSSFPARPEAGTPAAAG